jgi:hypothetical protein
LGLDADNLFFASGDIHRFFGLNPSFSDLCTF